MLMQLSRGPWGAMPSESPEGGSSPRGLVQPLPAGSQAAPPGGNGDGPAPAAGLLRVGTWNMSHWSAAKVAFLATSDMVDILAIQETHLAPLPLERAHVTARQAGLHLHHGRPAVPMPHSEHGRSCGGGFLCQQGLSVMPAIPTCPAWRRLAAMRRLHGVKLAPREGGPAPWPLAAFLICPPSGAGRGSGLL